MQTFTKVGLDALLTPGNCAVLLIDHQASQLANVNTQLLTAGGNQVRRWAGQSESVPNRTRWPTSSLRGRGQTRRPTWLRAAPPSWFSA